VEDAQAWIDHAAYEPVELCARFHHRLVFIHPFPNGNGRHARLAADLLGQRLGRRPFSWGARTVQSPALARSDYLRALRQGDGGDCSALTAFIDS
jgi:fido (protein-threonine AMPylation protein)